MPPRSRKHAHIFVFRLTTSLPHARLRLIVEHLMTGLVILIALAARRKRRLRPTRQVTLMGWTAMLLVLEQAEVNA